MNRFAAISVFILTTCLMTEAFGQLGRQQDNLMNGVKYPWKVISSDNYDVYYYTEDHLLGDQVARYAENALYDLTALLDYRNKSRFAIYLFNSPYDFIQSNRYKDPTYKEPGKTPIEDNSTSLIYPESSSELEARTRAQVARLLMREFYYGGGVQISIQNNVLLHTPPWFIDGFCDYLGEGWDFQDELWVGGLSNQEMLDNAQEGSGEINQLLRKSIWHFIVSTYGKEKLSEIFYMTRLTRSVESGTITVLGITLKTLTERWREFMTRKISINRELRDDFLKNASLIPLKRKDILISSSINPAGTQIAVYVIRGGHHKVLLYDLEKKTFSESGINGGFATYQLEGMKITAPMAWSPDGKFLLTTIFRGRREQMALYNATNGQVLYIFYNKSLDRVLDFSWSHDSKNLVVSGLRQGQINLYTLKPGTGNFRELTKDSWDNLHPVFSMDDQSIIFASNRPKTKEEGTGIVLNSYKNKLDLYSLPVNGDFSALKAITYTPEINETPLRAYSSFEVDYLTDASGIINLCRRNLFLGDSTNLTNITQGFYQLSLTEKKLAFVTPLMGKLSLFIADTETFTRPSDFFATELKQTIVNAKLQEEKLKRKIFPVENPTLNQDPKTTDDPEKIDLKTDEEITDSAKTEKPSVKYYVFDEEEDDYNPKKTRRNRRFLRSLTSNSPEEIAIRPDFSSIQLKTPRKAREKWVADFITIKFGFDPAHFGSRYRTALNFHMEAGFKDLMGNHILHFGLRPYFFNLKSYDVFGDYTFRKYKFDLRASIDYSSRHYFNLDFQMRYSWLTSALALSYPINRYTSIAGRVHGTWIQRRDLFLLAPSGLDGHDFVPGLGLHLLYDNTKSIHNFSWSGLRAEVDINTTASINQKEFNFLSVRTDVRKYTKVLKKLVFATRLAAGLSLGNNPQLFMLGGAQNWMISSIQNGGELPYNQKIASAAFVDFITPLRGFSYNARNGSKYVAINAELRIPFTRMLARFLNSKPMYNLEFIPFFDIGTIWNQGNPLSQKNPINNDPINAYPLVINVQTLKSPFLMGYGAGIRGNALGYSFRADLAWGMEDNTIQKPRLHLSLAKNF